MKNPESVYEGKSLKDFPIDPPLASKASEGLNHVSAVRRISARPDVRNKNATLELALEASGILVSTGTRWAGLSCDPPGP